MNDDADHRRWFLARAPRALWRALTAGRFEEPPQVLKAQLAQIWNSYPATFAASVSVTLGLIGYSYGDPGFWAVLLTGAMHVLICCHMFANWLRNRKAADFDESVVVQRLRAMPRNAAITSSGWFVFLSSLGINASAQEQLLTVTVMAGVIAIGTLRYSAVPAAAASFLATAAVVCVAYSFATTIPAEIYFFFAVFIAMLGKAVADQVTTLRSQVASLNEAALAQTELSLLRAQEAERHSAAAAREAAEQMAREAEQAQLHRATVSAIASA
ncbi:MAG TPA: hypothetical protein VE567_03685, partial [Sphingomonas sp.]|nr:hypothetical protein [Sphingomonas sp.]